MLTSAKAFEAAEAVKAGAQEVDMVINVGAVKDKDWDFVREDIRAVVEASKPVSYTHLDVYKRQTLVNEPFFPFFA